MEEYHTTGHWLLLLGTETLQSSCFVFTKKALSHKHTHIICQRVNHILLWQACKKTPWHVKSICFSANKYTFRSTKHDTPPPATHTHTHWSGREQQCEEWVALAQRAAAVKTGSKWCQSSKGLWEARPLWSVLGFYGSPERGRQIWSWTVFVSVWVRQCQHEEWSQPNLSRDIWRNMGGEENYFQVNSLHCDRQFGLQTDSKNPQVQTYNPPFFLFLSPFPMPLLLVQGKHSGGQQWHSARCAKSYQQTGSGSKSMGYRKESICVWVCAM